MTSEMCPQCRAVRALRATVSRRRVVGSDGQTREVVTRSFHCEQCNTFVRSEEVEVERAK